MPALNEDLNFLHVHPGNPVATAQVQAAFVGKSARRTLLPAGTALYKFTQWAVSNASGARVTPWWASVAPLAGFDDPGLSGHLAAAQQSGMTVLEYARHQFAVMFEWNTLGGPAAGQHGLARVERVRLTAPVYGFAGRCQQMWESPRAAQKGRILRQPVVWRGGAVQLYIPNLTTTQVTVQSSNYV